MKIIYYHIISKIIICYEAVIGVLYQFYCLEIVDDRVFQGVNVLKICFLGFFVQYNNPMDNMSVILIFYMFVNDKFEYNNPMGNVCNMYKLVKWESGDVFGE